MGIVGDAVGRPLALALTLSIAATAACLSALAAWGTTVEVYLLIGLWRFVLGFGVGGLYPLSSAVAYESSSGGGGGGGHGEEEDKEGTMHAATALFMQIPGHIAVYIVAWVLLQPGWSFDVQWRALLLSGGLPLAIIIPAALAQYFEQRDSNAAVAAEHYGKVVIGERNGMGEEPPLSSPSESGGGGGSRSLWLGKDLATVMRDPRARGHLMGCSLSWFILDFYIYGVSTFSPLLLAYIFKDTATLAGNCWQNVVSNAVTLPVAALSVLALTTSADPRDLQIVGFLVAAAALVVFSVTWVRLKDDPHKLFGLFCMLKGAMVLFVPSTTFTLPNSLFPVHIRTSCNGIAAAAGKLGAFAGAMLFPVIFELFGMVTVCMACALAALVGAASTAALLPRRRAQAEVTTAASGTRLERQPLLKEVA